ncbi:HNH endonuclease signature motif containing protein [Nocardia sp. 348MFTsu5.1]|uniref:HNH endonuclease signature motif containing protein n=1 Tax=Nocardia sp. 348MFTsu5.1 TaxID=1172185 RepID=UPI00037A2401|nr:HNH endonuclease signature motif containing protein [Nocardia sp. 348MFTsu5.1]
MTSGVADLIDRIKGMALDAEEIVAVREVLSRRLVDVSLATLSDKETVDLAQAVESQTRRDEAVKVRITVELRERSVAAKQGLKHNKFLRHQLRISAAEASARSKRSERVGQWHTPSGEVVPPVYPNTWEAVRDGAIGIAHYNVIHEVLRALPGTIRSDLALWSEGERLMAQAARTMDPDELKRVGLHLHNYLNPDGEFDDVDRAQKRDLKVSKQGADHMSGITGHLDPATKALWDVVAAKWAAQGMNNPNDPDSPSGPADKADKETLEAAAKRDTRTPGQRNHDAFKRLMEMVVGQGMLGQHRGLPAKVIVTMTLEQLEAETGLATTASGGVMTIKDALQLAGVSRKYLALLDDKHRPLFWGREKRLATADQRLALIAAERGCSRPGCDAPATECAVHHMDEYSKGGRTDITVLTLVCGPDHAQVNDGDTGWITEIINEGTGPPGWQGRVGWRQRGSLSPPEPNNTHFPEKYFTNPEMWNPESDADADWFKERARAVFEQKAAESSAYKIDFGWRRATYIAA